MVLPTLKAKTGFLHSAIFGTGEKVMLSEYFVIFFQMLHKSNLALGKIRIKQGPGL